MRAFLSLGVSALLVSMVLGAMVAPNTPVRLMPGKTYLYSYTGRLVSGIAQFGDSAAVLEIKSDIVLQPEQGGSQVAMKMTNIRVGKHNGQVRDQLNGEVVMEHHTNEEYDRELSKPIRFQWVNGQVKTFVADQTEPEWSINVKKSVLSMFNLNLTPQKIIRNDGQKQNSLFQVDQDQLVVYPVYEDGVNGICETLYQQTKGSEEFQTTTGAEEEVLRVTKTRNYDNCLTQPSIESTNVDVRGAPVVCEEGKSYPLIEGYYPMSSEEQKWKLGGCQAGQTEKKTQESPVNSYNYVKYNITNQKQGYPTIESAYGKGKTVFESSGKKLSVVSHQKLTLKKIDETSRVGPIEQVSNGIGHEELSFRLPKHPEQEKLDIPYYHLFGKVNKIELAQMVPQLLQSVADDLAEKDISQEKKTMQNVVQLTNAIAVLDMEHLEQIYQQYIEAGRSDRATTQEQVVRKLFIDLLGSCGSTQAALFAKKLYERDLLTTYEAKECFEAIPQNLFLVDVKVLEEYLNLFLTEKVQKHRQLASSLGICLGKMIRESEISRKQTPGDIHDYETIQKSRQAQQYVNGNENRSGGLRRSPRSAPWENQFKHELVTKEQIMQVLQVLERTLREAKTFHQKVTLIETLAHMGIKESLQLLAQYVNDKASFEELPGYLVENEDDLHEERNFIRQVTIYALAHVSKQYPEEVMALLLPVYHNRQEPYEVRIAAYTVILTCRPSRRTLEQIASELHTENNRQVVSFVCSSLKTVSKSTMPSNKKLAENARFAASFLPKTELGLEYSKLFAKEYYEESKKYGLSMVSEWVSNNQSQVPRSGYFSLKQTNGPYQNVLFELGYNAKGIDSLINRLIDSKGFLSDAFESINTQPKDRRMNKRNAESAKQAVQALKEQLNQVIRAEEEPKATIFMKMFERTSYYSFDRTYLRQMIDSAEDYIKELTQKLTQGKSYHYVKLMMPNKLYKVVSSELGFPVVITERHPTILSVQLNEAKLELNMPEKSILPNGAQLSCKVQPKILQTTYQFAFAIEPVSKQAIGCEVQKSVRFSLPVELNAGYSRQDKKFTFSVVPKVSHEIVHYSTNAKTFISKASIAGSPDRDWHEDVHMIKTRPVAFHFEKRYLHDLLGMGVNVQVSTESNRFAEPIFKTKTAKKNGILAELISLLRNDQITPCNVHFVLEADKEKQVTGYDFEIQYKRVRTGTEQDDDQYEQEEEYRNRQEMVYNRRSTLNSVFPTEQAWEQIFGNKFDWKSIKQVSYDTMRETRKVWEDKLWQKRQVSEQETLPAIVAHDLIFTAVSRSPQPTYYGANVLLIKTVDEQTYWCKVKSFAKQQAGEQESKQLCIDSVISYPQSPSPFYYEPIKTQDLKAKLYTWIGFGQDCYNGGKIEINGKLEKTEDRVITEQDQEQQSGLSARQAKDWYFQQCEIDQAQGKSLSYACERAIEQDSLYQQYVMDIEYENIPAEFVNLTRKLLFGAKMAFYHQMQLNDIDVENELNKIRLTAQFSTRYTDLPMANIYIETPKENIHFEKIRVPYIRPVSSLYSTYHVYKHLVAGYGNNGKCMLMENHVRTFDNVTVELQKSQCQYLLAKDCSASEKFAIYAQQLTEQTKTITVLIGGSEIKLLPPTRNTQVVFDGETFELNEQKQSIWKNGVEVHIRQTTQDEQTPLVVVKHLKEKITIQYDGKNVQVKVGKQYKGKTCGICGDFNGEFEAEFTGPDACQYENAEDYINSYALSGEHCEQVPVSQGAKKCPAKSEGITTGNQYSSRFTNQLRDYGKHERTNQIRSGEVKIERVMNRQSGQPMTLVQRNGLYGAQIQQQQQIQRLRTHYIHHQNQLCFSVQPILSCIEGVSRPYQMQQQVLGYHCLPASSLSAQKLMEQARRQVLTVFGKKTIDITSYVQVPVACVAY